MKRIFVVFAATAVAGLGVAAPASAHPGHRDCDPGAKPAATAPGPFGEVVRLGAHEGRGVSEEVALLHTTCAPVPQ